jgi:phospholipid-binding lipoprotein MlaA
MRRARLWSKWTTAWVIALLVSACASAPHDASLPISDPNESANRQVLAANQRILGPVSEGVRAAVPGPVHERLHDLNSNLKEPRILVNNLLQLRFDAAARTTTRFVVNTTVGVGGLFDVAGRNGIAQQSGDFGQTLFVWGVSEGPYVVWPYLGPSTQRDAVGSVVDMAANPLGWLIGTQIALATTQVAVSAGTTTVDAVDRLGQLKTAEDASLDFYSFVRSSYYQMRRAELREAVGLPSVVESPATSDIDDGDNGPADATKSVAVAR